MHSVQILVLLVGVTGQSDQKFKKLMKEHDADHDRAFTYEEFKAFTSSDYVKSELLR